MTFVGGTTFVRSISDLILVKWHVTCIMMVDDTIRGPADFLRQTAQACRTSEFRGGSERYSNPIVNPSLLLVTHLSFS